MIEFTELDYETFRNVSFFVAKFKSIDFERRKKNVGVIISRMKAFYKNDMPSSELNKYIGSILAMQIYLSEAVRLSIDKKMSKDDENYLHSVVNIMGKITDIVETSMQNIPKSEKKNALSKIVDFIKTRFKG